MVQSNPTVGTAVRVPFVDLKKQYLSIKPEVDAAIHNVMDNTYYIDGPFVEQFEKDFAVYCGVKHALAVDSGTAAVELGLHALDFKPGDEIIIPAHTFIATAAPADLHGLRCVFVDVDNDTWQMTAEHVRAAITQKTKAVMIVHLYGQPVPVDEIRDVCREHKLILIEDACQSHGALYKGARTGAFGEFAAFSCYPAKNLGAFGDGGVVTTNNDDLAAKVKMLRNHGSFTKYEHVRTGYNYRMDAFQGAVLGIKLKHLDKWNDQRRQRAAQYHARLAKLPVRLPKAIEGTEPVWHLYTLHTPLRDKLGAHLAEHNIDKGIHYPVPLHLQPAFAHLGYKTGDLPNAERIGRETLSLPMFPEMTEEQCGRVCQAVESFF